MMFLWFSMIEAHSDAVRRLRIMCAKCSGFEEGGEKGRYERVGFGFIMLLE